MTGERLEELDIPLDGAARTRAPFGTAFCVPIEAKDITQHRHFRGGSRGHRARRDRPRDTAGGPGAARAHVSADARATAACSCAPARPRRPSISARIAGLYPAGVICEIMNEDGTMARVPELARFARRHKLPDDHDRGSDQIPDADRGAGAARRRREAADRVRRVPRHRLRERPRQARRTSRW